MRIVRSWLKVVSTSSKAECVPRAVVHPVGRPTTNTSVRIHPWETPIASHARAQAEETFDMPISGHRRPRTTQLCESAMSHLPLGRRPLLFSKASFASPQLVPPWRAS
jgi:hypothetical protein